MGTPESLRAIDARIQTRTGFISGSGQVLCDVDKAWVTNSSELSGFSSTAFTQKRGTGLNPTVTHEDLGWLIPHGRKISKLTMIGRVNHSEVSDVEIILIRKNAIDENDWTTGISSLSEFKEERIYQDFWKNHSELPSIGPAINIHKRKFLIPEEDQLTMAGVEQSASVLSLYFKPVGTITVARQFHISFLIEIV